MDLDESPAVGGGLGCAKIGCAKELKGRVSESIPAVRSAV